MPCFGLLLACGHVRLLRSTPRGTAAQRNEAAPVVGPQAHQIVHLLPSFRIPLQQNPIRACAVSPNRAFVATGCIGAADTSLIVWSAETGEALASVDTPHPHGTVALAVSADNRLLASLSAPFPVVLQGGENLPGGMGQTPPAAWT